MWNTLGYLLDAIDMVRLNTRLNIVSKMSVNTLWLLSKLAIEMDSIASMWLQPLRPSFSLILIYPIITQHKFQSLEVLPSDISFVAKNESNSVDPNNIAKVDYLILLLQFFAPKKLLRL